jgi:phage terminase large subunit-like protein
MDLIPGYDPYRDARGFAFDAERADRVVDFFSTQLVFIEGKKAGQPFVLEDWQAAWVGCLFGWVDSKGLRRYRECLDYVPRKNGKSPIVGGIMDYVLFCDGEPGAQCYCAAADREQASIVFRHAAGMVERNPALTRECVIYRSLRSMEFAGSFARVLTSEAASKHGYNSHLVIVDELHAQPDRELVDVLTSSTGTREQPIVIYVTTADFDRPSICNDKLDYAKKVRDGLINDPRFLPVIYETPEDADWEDEAVWRAANPGMGSIKSLDYMRRECAKAKDEPSYQGTFRRLELNQRTPTQSVWIDMTQWDACQGEIDWDRLKDVECWGGLDLSASRDVTALVLCWPNADMGPLGVRTVVRAWHWIPEDVAAAKEKTDRVPYRQWHDEGLVEFTPGNVTDYGFIRAALRDDILPLFAMKDLGADPWNATHLITELTEQDGVPVVAFRQGFVSMSGPAKEFERLVAGGKLLHDGNPLLRWQVSNAVVRRDPAGNIKPDKEKSSQRIDGLVASIMSVGRASVESANDKGPSVYEDRGMLVL